jgi:hypothetical protein
MPDSSSLTLSVNPWMPLLALFLGMIVHALSADEGRSLLEKFGAPPLPRSWLPYLTILFGVGAGVTNSLVLGKGLQESIIGALAAMATATFGLSATRIAHDTAGGGGKSSGGPPTAIVSVGALLLATLLSGCALFTPANLPNTILTGETIACVLQNAFVDDPTLDAVCTLLTPEERAAARQVAKVEREQVTKRLSAARAETCDGGVK